MKPQPPEAGVLEWSTPALEICVIFGKKNLILDLFLSKLLLLKCSLESSSLKNMIILIAQMGYRGGSYC